MVFRTGGSPKAPPAPKRVPSPGGVSAVGPRPPAVPPVSRKTKTRWYGKPEQGGAAPAPSPNPFGPDMPGGF